MEYANEAKNQNELVRFLKNVPLKALAFEFPATPKIPLSRKHILDIHLQVLEQGLV